MEGSAKLGAILCVKRITSAGTATPISLRLRLHSMGARAARVRGKIRVSKSQIGILDEIA